MPTATLVGPELGGQRDYTKVDSGSVSEGLSGNMHHPELDGLPSPVESSHS